MSRMEGEMTGSNRSPTVISGASTAQKIDFRWVFGGHTRVESVPQHVHSQRAAPKIDYTQLSRLIRGEQGARDDDSTPKAGAVPEKR